MSRGSATGFAEASFLESQTNVASTSVATSKSSYGAQLPARREHSSLGEQDQVTHTMRNRKTKNNNFNCSFYGSKKFISEMEWKIGANLAKRMSQSESKPYSFPAWVTDDYMEETDVVQFPNWVFDEHQDYDPIVAQSACGLSGPTPPCYTVPLFGFKPLTERFPIPTPDGFVRKFIVFGHDLTLLRSDPKFDLDSIGTFSVGSSDVDSVDQTMFDGELLEPQSFVVDILTSAGVSVTDSVMSWIEDLVTLYQAIKGCVSLSQFCAICVIYIKRYVKGSILKTTIDYFKEVISDLVPQSDDETTCPFWLSYFRDLKDNWNKVVSSPVFSKLSKLIGMAVSLGLCTLSDVSFNVFGVRAFALNLREKHVTAKSFIDCILDTISFFLEGGYQCFKQGSLRPLLLGDESLAKYESQYYDCIECADLARAGNLEKLKGMTENDYEKLLVDTIEFCDSYCKASVPGTEKSILLRQKEKLLHVYSQFRQTRLQGGLREAPYAIGVFGPSGVGKSSIAQLLMTSTLQANGYNADDDRVVTLNEGDKFMSNYRSYVNGIYIDDLGNTKNDFVERSPAQKIIEIVNNVHAYATMPEAELKGKVAIEPKVVLITRNVKERFAHDYSNEPVSILRREKITLTVRVKEQFATQFMLDQDKVADFYGENPPCIPDLWEIDVERAHPVKNPIVGRPDLVGWEFVKLDGRELESCSIFDVIRYVHQDSRNHFSHQKSLVNRMKDMSSKLAVCKSCGFPAEMCGCKLEPHSAAEYCASLHSRVCQPIQQYYDDLKHFDSSWVSVVNCMPDYLYHSRIGKLIVDWKNYPLYKEHFEKLKRRAYVLCCCALFLSLFDSRFVLLGVPIIWYFYHCYRSYRTFLMEKVISERSAIPILFKNFRDNHVKYITGGCVALAGIYGAIRAYRAFCAVKPQGSLSPKTMADIEARDAEANPWLHVESEPMHTSDKSKCITYKQLEHLAAKNLCHVTLVAEGRKTMCNAFFPKSNVALIPSHIWRAREFEATFVRKDPGLVGSNFKALISRDYSVDIPNSDFSLVWVPNGGSWKDLTHYLPHARVNSSPASVVYKGADGSVGIAQTMVQPGLVKAIHMSYYGLNYTIQDRETFRGLCMAPIVSQTRAPALVGFHLAGKTGTGIGAAGIVCAGELDVALSRLHDKEGVLLSSSHGTMPVERFDCQFFETPAIHEKSPTRFLSAGSNLEVYGSVKGRSTYHSEVVATPISQTVEEICGVPNSWGKPQFHSWKPWQASLQYSSRPSPGMPGNLLVVAVSDYRDGLLAKISEIPDIISQTRPLEKMEVVCGIDGRRFIDKMPVNTSMGYPLGGPKSDYIALLDTDDYPDHACPAELDDRFWSEADLLERKFLEGERGYPIFKGCLKDEPTPVHKDKVRVFQSAPIELQLLIRKYFLPVARLLSIFPLHSECAVGINAQGPEWESFTMHICKYGEDRIFAGDYSKYDLRMPSQLVLAAFRVLIDIAKRCGYSQDHIVVMEGIATEVAYPLMAYNGDLIQLFGSNPSGQNLTVYINGIVNSLLVRCYLASLGYLPKYKSRDIIAFLTYGDDIKGSVKVGYDVSIKGYAAFLKEYDMVFTMPDKDSELVDLMTDDDADFLKRSNVFLPELGMHLGALDEKSIFKSLHSVLKSSSISLRQQSMMNIEGALREWFAHGRNVYEKRRSQMAQIVYAHGFSHGCPGIQLSFDDRVQAFKEKYCMQDIELGTH